jgi:hypothetical protein
MEGSLMTTLALKTTFAWKTTLALKILASDPAENWLPRHSDPVLRALTTGTAWGLVLAAGLTGVTFYGCGVFCAADAAVTTALSIGAGILTVGPSIVLGERA